MQNFFENVYYVLIYTPWWVYVLFIYLIFIGIKASKPRKNSLIKLAIVPLVFLILSIDSLMNETSLHSPNLLAYIIAMLIGILIGFLIAKHIGGHAIKDKKGYLINLPGSWLVLILIIIIFTAKYYFGIRLGYHPELINNLKFTIIMLSIYGLTSGIFIGRFLFYLSIIVKAKKS